jgi:hypothetical protein
MGDSLRAALQTEDKEQVLDIGCIAANGIFHRSGIEFILVDEKKAATAFLLELIARLQETRNSTND